jgi:eukaryotic-like serine/threonine-protein kinase
MEEVMEGALPAHGSHVLPDYLPPGTEVNGFRLVRHANSGGYGSVWLAESVHCPGQYYALKFSLGPPGDPRRADERAEREVRLLLQAAHPNILCVIAHGRWRDPNTGTRYLAMPWVEGATLLKWTRQHNPPLRRLVRMVQTVARALQAAHEAGVVHRDVKPSNVLVRSADGEPFLGDFGAGDAAGAPTLTQPGLPPGTSAYRSPEAWGFARRAQTAPYPFQPADDWYALGVTLYVLLTQVVPFPEKLEGKSFDDWVRRRHPVPPHLLNARVPRALSQVVMRLLAKQPRRRYRDGYALCGALERALEARENWDIPVYPLHATTPAAVQQPAGPEGGTAQEQVGHPFGEQPESPSEKQREEVAHRRDELLPRQPRAWPVSRRLVAVAAMFALVVAVVWPVWRRLSTRSGTRQTAGAPATTVPLPAPVTPESAPPLCPSMATPPWEQSPTETGSPPPPLSFLDPPFWKDDTPVTTLSPLARSTLAALSTVALTACPAVPVRPEPPTCSKAAIEAMDKLGIQLGDEYEISLRGEYLESDISIELVPGPIVSGIRSDPDNPYPLPQGTRLFGRVLPTPGDEILIRYTELQIPPGERVPICAIARDAWKKSGNPEEFVATTNRASVEWVLAFPR